MRATVLPQKLGGPVSAFFWESVGYFNPWPTPQMLQLGLSSASRQSGSLDAEHRCLAVPQSADRQLEIVPAASGAGNPAGRLFPLSSEREAEACCSGLCAVAVHGAPVYPELLGIGL